MTGRGKGGKGLQLSFKFRFDVRYRYSNPIRCLGCCWKMGQTIARDVMRLRQKAFTRGKIVREMYFEMSIATYPAEDLV